MEALKDPEAKVRAAAAQSLGSFKEHVKLVTAPVLERSKDDDAGVRREVALALGNLGKGEPGVEQALKSLEQD
ncbi:MAG: HEAT repeat domain-containing protein, partial [Thermodesulfobacteriota bacterium]